MPQTSQSLSYAASPYRLALADLVLWARITFVWPPSKGIPSIIFPIWPYRSGALDELYPTVGNLKSVILQLVFTAVQALFFISLPISAVFGIGFPFLPPFVGAYTPVWLTWVLSFFLVNRGLSNLLLNGTRGEYLSQAPLSTTELEAHQDEKWVFVNGVAVGSHWMQSNLDRISLAFRREVHGIHNPTRGIVFDLIECILERTFSYPTPSTRTVYRRLLDIISNDKYKRIVLILHSQGAIEGGLALDWLFATVPGTQLSRVEVYTFGSAANHFNNPIATTMTSDGKRIDVDGSDNAQHGRILQHIEHYANSGDYVAKFGILNFRPLPPSMRNRTWDRQMYMWDPETMQEVENRYVGRLFIRSGTGHQLNGNYLDDYFPMDPELTEVLEDNEFMDGIIDRKLLDEDDIVALRGQTNVKGGNSGRKMGHQGVGEDEGDKPFRVKDVSRLWMYRNGMSPPDDEAM